MTHCDAEAKGCVAVLCMLPTCIMFGLGLGLMLGRSQALSEIRTEAVQRGKGQWVVGFDGKTKFKWKEEVPQE